MLQIKNIRFQTISLLMVLFVAGCGFHLRGAIELPALYERVYLLDKGYADISKPLIQAFESVGVIMVGSPAEATSIITLLSRGTQRRAVNVAGREIREYELQLDVTFVVQDAQGIQLSDAQTVSIIRNFKNDVNNTLGKDNEEDVIREEMNQAAILQILRRLKAIAP